MDFYMPMGPMFSYCGGKKVGKKDVSEALEKMNKDFSLPDTVKKLETALAEKMKDVIEEQDNVIVKAFYAKVGNSLLIKVGSSDDIEYWVQNVDALSPEECKYISHMRSAEKNCSSVMSFQEGVEKTLKEFQHAD